MSQIVLEEFVFEVLLYDVIEVYCRDIFFFFKCLLFDYKVIEYWIDMVICEKFGFFVEMFLVVYYCDLIMLVIEC